MPSKYGFVLSFALLSACWGEAGGSSALDAGESTGGGTASTGGGTASTGGGSASTGGGTASTGGGSASTGGGTASTGGGTASTGGGTASTGGGTASTGGGTASTGGGTASTGGGTASTDGGTAIPQPTSVDQTTLTHRARAVLQGTDFGVRDVPVSRILFDEATGSSVNDLWDFSCNDGAAANWRMEYRRPDQIVKANGVTGGVPTPHPRIARYASGAPYMPGGGSWNVCLGKNHQQDQRNTYINVYSRIDPDFHFNCSNTTGSDCDRNYKEHDWAIGGGYMGTNGSNVYAGVMWAGTGNATVQWGFNNGEINACGSSGCTSLPVTSFNSAVHDYYPMYGSAPSKVSTPGPISGWIKLEFELRHDDVQGLERLRVNNILAHDLVVDARLTTSNPERSETVVGGYHRDSGDTELYKNNFRYYSQIFYDRSFARVVLVNNANYAQATLIEPQKLTAWSDTSIAFDANLGALPAGSTAYLFVFNQAGVRSNTGLPVMVGE